MKTASKTEIVIPVWAGRTGPSYWGDKDYSSCDNQSSSLWVSFLGVLAGDRHNYLNDDCRAIGDLGLYVYVTVDGTVSIDLRLHDAGSMTLRESEQRIKALKRLFVKGKPLTASWRTRAFLWPVAEHLRNHVLELINEHAPVIAAKPLVPNSGQEVTPVIRV